MNNHFEPITLNEWLNLYSHSEEDLRNVFLNLDVALKYIHEHGYCVEVFYPTMIEILDHKIDHIRFKKLIELSKNPARRKEMIREDVFNSSLIQIGIYSNSLKYLKPEFLKENFESFTQFIPSGDVPYYRGVIQRGATVYLCEYDAERRKKDLADLERQVEGEGNSGNKTLVRSNGTVAGIEPVANDRINDTIYRQINGLNDSAFIHALIIPTVIMAVIFLFGLLAWIMSMFA